MLRLVLSLLALMAAGSVACAIEARLDSGTFDRTSLAFLAAFGVSLTALLVLLTLHFGRIA